MRAADLAWGSLESEYGEPVLEVQQEFRALKVTLSVYPSDRFSYAMRLRYNRQSKKEQIE